MGGVARQVRVAVVEQAVEHGPCVIWASMLLCARSKVSDLFLLLRNLVSPYRSIRSVPPSSFPWISPSCSAHRYGIRPAIPITLLSLPSSLSLSSFHSVHAPPLPVITVSTHPRCLYLFTWGTTRLM